jgi:hypothetical protein
LIEEVSVEIGGQIIDKHYGEWLQIWSELTLPSEKKTGYENMVHNAGDAAKTLYVPLQFWFCRNAGLALPLIALQYHEVKFNITFRPVSQLLATAGTNTGLSLSNASLYVDYIYLDTDERRQFAQVQHEYLIEQLQFTGSETIAAGTVKSKLAFNHPCKELIFTIQKSGDDAGKSSGTFTGSAKLQLNGADRFSARKASYFQYVQPYQHHTCIPEDNTIFVYSFALNPEQHQPSGSCNFSRIDNATLHVTEAEAGSLRVYATNYNVLRIVSGMGGLAYSN